MPHKYLYKRKPEGDYGHTEKETWRQDWNDVSTGPGLLAAPRSWDKQGLDLPVETLKEGSSVDTLILDIRPPKL